VFKTPSGRAQLTVNELDVIDVPEGAALLQTIRSHDQFNTTIYGLNDRYRGIRAGRRVVLVNGDDLKGLGVANGQTVDVVGPDDRRAERFRVVAYPTARGCIAGYFPELNPLVPLDSVALESGTPASKSVVVRLVPHAGSPAAHAGDEESIGSVAVRQ
jgi:anaerobic selenocysteine-containing dehydrogenase